MRTKTLFYLVAVAVVVAAMLTLFDHAENMANANQARVRAILQEN